MGHNSEECWKKWGKPPIPKRDRSPSTERSGGNSGRRMKGRNNPKHNSRQVLESESPKDQKNSSRDIKQK